MTKEEYAKVVAANMRRIMYDREKTQADLARDLHLNKSTVSSWMNGTRTPKIDKIDLLCVLIVWVAKMTLLYKNQRALFIFLPRWKAVASLY
jgi:transcriptional regulator with XRE-family HTH domain